MKKKLTDKDFLAHSWAKPCFFSRKQNKLKNLIIKKQPLSKKVYHNI
jgi:hypothetical protein